MKTLYDKIWVQYQVCNKPDGTTIVFIRLLLKSG